VQGSPRGEGPRIRLDRAEHVEQRGNGLALLLFAADRRRPVARLETVRAELRVIAAVDAHERRRGWKVRHGCLLLLDVGDRVTRSVDARDRQRAVREAEVARVRRADQDKTTNGGGPRGSEARRDLDTPRVARHHPALHGWDIQCGGHAAIERLGPFRPAEHAAARHLHENRRVPLGGNRKQQGRIRHRIHESARIEQQADARLAGSRLEHPVVLSFRHLHCIVALQRVLRGRGRAIGDGAPRDEYEGGANSRADPDAADLLPQAPRRFRHPDILRR
jgi:hypothetical protein